MAARVSSPRATTLPSGATLVAVRPDGVTIRDAGGERAIALRAQPAAAAAPTARAATRGSIAGVHAACRLQGARSSGSMPSWFRGSSRSPKRLRATADASDGGLVIRDEGGFAALLGLKKGDRIAQANGIALRSPDDVVVAVLRPLAASQPVRLVGSRGSEPRELMLVNASACPR